jgi:hypothetical protein
MDVQEYLVTLCVRLAELKGLKELPGSTKDNLTPLVLLAPWLMTSPLSRALEKFEEAYPSRPYFIDVDTYYEPSDSNTEAKDTWRLLAHPPADIETWSTLLADYPNANPCLLMAGQTIETVREQIAWARENDRIFCLRFNLASDHGSGIPAWMPELIQQLAEEGANDFAVVLEFGWVTDALSVAALAIGYTNSFFSTLPPEVPIAVSCTSFPRDFTSFDGTDDYPFSNRALIAQVSQNTNHPRIIYGDWGTTRPRSYRRANQPRNRIDYPTDNSWLFAREGNGQISFLDAAQRIMNDAQWAGNLGVWGEQMIEGAAAGQNFAIDTMPQMYAARINIHLHRQAFFGHLPPPGSLDEEWNDEEL